MTIRVTSSELKAVNEQLTGYASFKDIHKQLQGLQQKAIKDPLTGKASPLTQDRITVCSPSIREESSSPTESLSESINKLMESHF